MADSYIFFLNQITQSSEPQLDKQSKKFTTAPVIGCPSASLRCSESVQKT